MKTRQSNIELLRIIVMILIIITHLVVWGGLKTDNINQDQMNSSILFNNLIRWHVNVFIIITGYFGIKSRLSCLKVIVMSIFYTWVLYFFECTFTDTKFSFTTILKSLFFITHTKYWFVQSYILLIILAPFFNLLIKKEIYKHLLIAFLFIDSWCGFIHNETISNGFGIIHFITMYIIGRGIKLYDIKMDIKLLIVLFISICIFISIQTIYLKGLTSGNGYNNPFLIINAVIIFLIFKDKSISNKTINFFANSSFAVYLIHDSDLGHYIIRMIMIYINYIAINIPSYIIYIIIAGFIIYIISCIIDKLMALIYIPIVEKINYILKTNVFK